MSVYLDSQGQPDGIAQRTSYLMNSLLSHKSRRYGHWTQLRFIREVGSSQFICFRRTQRGRLHRRQWRRSTPGRLRHLLGTGILKPWFATERHLRQANYLYLDGHVTTLPWETAVPDLYPDKVVLTQD